MNNLRGDCVHLWTVTLNSAKSHSASKAGLWSEYVNLTTAVIFIREHIGIEYRYDFRRLIVKFKCRRLLLFSV